MAVDFDSIKYGPIPAGGRYAIGTERKYKWTVKITEPLIGPKVHISPTVASVGGAFTSAEAVAMTTDIVGDATVGPWTSRELTARNDPGTVPHDVTLSDANGVRVYKVRNLVVVGT